VPYLHCPNCRLTVYRPPAVAEPQRCARCGVRLTEGVRSLFASDLSAGAAARRMREALRGRAAGQGGLSPETRRSPRGT
jgi:hypothetical protein